MEKKMYFDEEKMQKCLELYKKNNNKIALEVLFINIQKIAEGMFNKHFNKNKKLMKNKEDVLQQSLLEVFKSLHRYDEDKGKLYSFINRIIKNTFLNYDLKMNKLEKEIPISSFISQDENILEDEIFDVIKINDNEFIFGSKKNMKLIKLYDYFKKDEKIEPSEKTIRDYSYIYNMLTSIENKLEVALKNHNIFKEYLLFIDIEMDNGIIIDDYVDCTKGLKNNIDEIEIYKKLFETTITTFKKSKEWIKRIYNVDKNINFKDDNYLLISKNFMKHLTKIKNQYLKIPKYIDRYKYIEFLFNLYGENIVIR